MYLTYGYVSFFTIHLGYSKDTFRIQCILTLRYMTHKIHARYMSDTKGYIRGYVSRALLAGALGYPQTPEIRVPHVSRMYPACISHVSRMYPACILITSEDTCISHVSRMYPACLNSYQIHLSLDAFEIHVSRMYLACIPHVS
jgi:hypothetical protein